MLLTAKWTRAPEGKLRSGSRFWPGGLGMAVDAVLFDGVVDRLGVVGLQFDGGDGNAIEEQDQVEAVFVVEGIPLLADDAEAVGGVAVQNLLIEGEGRFELGHGEGPAEAEHIEPIPQHMQRAQLVEAKAEAL